MARVDSQNGALTPTESPLDLALEGDGYFGVQTPNGPRYTRAGNFQLDQGHNLVTADGYQVRGQGGAPINVPPEAGDIAIAADGTVSAGGSEIGKLELVRFAPSQMKREGGTLFSATGRPAGGEPPRVRSGMLEASNVNVVRGVVDLVKVSRTYESLMRMIQGAGPRGLAAIPPRRERFIRPLIETSRAEIVAELVEAGVAWREDPTNLDVPREFGGGQLGKHRFAPTAVPGTQSATKQHVPCTMHCVLSVQNGGLPASADSDASLSTDASCSTGASASEPSRCETGASRLVVEPSLGCSRGLVAVAHAASNTSKTRSPHFARSSSVAASTCDLLGLSPSVAYGMRPVSDSNSTTPSA